MAYFRCGGGVDSSVLALPTPSEASGAIARFNTDLTENLLSAVAEFSASQASGTPTPSAPIPIVGVDKVNITRTGKNLLSTENWTNNYYISATGVKTADSNSKYSYPIKVNVGDTYTFSGHNSSTSGGNKRLHGYDKNGVWVSQLSYVNVGVNQDYQVSATIPNGVDYLVISCLKGDTDIMLELGSTATTYEPYNGTTALINLGGTYYGGKVDVVTGKTTLTHQLYTFTGSSDENWSILDEGGTAQRFRLQPKYDGATLIACTHCQLTNSNTADWGYCRFGNYYFLLTDSNNQIGSVENLRTWLATQNTNGTPLSILVELAEPIVVYASNTAEIPTLNGDNQVFADTGDVAVKYFETVGHKI